MLMTVLCKFLGLLTEVRGCRWWDEMRSLNLAVHPKGPKNEPDGP